MDFALSLRDPQPTSVIDHCFDDPAEQTYQCKDNCENKYPPRHLLPHLGHSVFRRPQARVAEVVPVTDEVAGIMGDFRMLGKEGSQIWIRRQICLISQERWIQSEHLGQGWRVLPEKALEQLAGLL